MYSIEMEEVTKSFGSHIAVNRLSLEVPSGCIYGFIGPNGSGKTTTLRMIMNIFYPDSGSIQVLGRPVSQSLTNRIGYLPEERGLYKKMKVRDVLQFYGKLKSGRNCTSQINHWLKRLDLMNWADKKIDSLSKGMSQKVQFIATVIAEPDLIILDEPFSGLDPVNAEALKSAILDLKANGATIIFSTHDMAVAEKMCDYVFMIFKGQKVLDGTLESIQEDYGRDTIRLSTDNGQSRLTEIAGIQSVNDYGKMQEIRMTPDADPQKILCDIMTVARIHHFEIASPSLHDIFIRIAGPEAQEASHE